MKAALFLLIFLIFLPAFASAITLNITIESPNKNTINTIVAKPGASIFIYGKAYYANGTVIASKPINFTYSGIQLGTNNTAADGTYNFTFNVPFIGNYSFQTSTNDTSGNSGTNSTILYITSVPLNVKYRLSYHLGSSKSDDVERTGNFNESVDSLSVSRFFYSSDSNLAHAYSCTYDTTSSPPQLLTMIHSYQRSTLNYINLTMNSGLTDYIMELSQQIASSSLIVAYTQGTCQLINNNMYLVENNQIPSRSFAGFVLGAAKSIPFLIRVQYPKTVLNGSEIFGAGTDNMCISKDSIAANNYPVVTVKRC